MTKASVKRGHAGPPQHVPTELLQQVNQEAEIAGRLSLARMSEAVRKRFVLPSGVDIVFQHFWGHTMSAVQSIATTAMEAFSAEVASRQTEAPTSTTAAQETANAEEAVAASLLRLRKSPRRELLSVPIVGTVQWLESLPSMPTKACSGGVTVYADLRSECEAVDALMTSARALIPSEREILASKLVGNSGRHYTKAPLTSDCPAFTCVRSLYKVAIKNKHGPLASLIASSFGSYDVYLYPFAMPLSEVRLNATHGTHPHSPIPKPKWQVFYDASKQVPMQRAHRDCDGPLVVLAVSTLGKNLDTLFFLDQDEAEANSTPWPMKSATPCFAFECSTVHAGAPTNPAPGLDMFPRARRNKVHFFLVAPSHPGKPGWQSCAEQHDLPKTSKYMLLKL